MAHDADVTRGRAGALDGGGRSHRKAVHEVDDAVAVRAHDARARAFRKSREPRLALPALGRAAFGEAAGIDRRERNPDRGAIGEHVEHTLRRHDDADVIWRLGQVLQTGMTLEAVDFPEPRIDRIDAAREAEAGHRLEQASAERRGMVRRADDRHCARGEESPEIGSRCGCDAHAHTAMLKQLLRCRSQYRPWSSRRPGSRTRPRRSRGSPCPPARGS